MKKGLIFSVAILAAVVAAPVMAGDGNVPASTLKQVGLGALKSVSDVEGMKVRGMSSNAQATSVAFGSILLFDPNTGTNFSFSGADFGRATDENAGLNATSSVGTDAGLVSTVALNLTVTFNAITFNGTVSPFTIGGAANATSP